MGFGDFFESVGDALSTVADAASTAAESVDWETVGKVAAVTAGVGAVGVGAYCVGEQIGHTEGEKDGYAKASGEYASKFEDQEKRFRKVVSARDAEISKIMKGLEGNATVCGFRD